MFLIYTGLALFVLFWAYLLPSSPSSPYDR
ncbi:hypothetical protein 101220B2_054 [Escherichia phage vB_EcoP-101120B2]|nr:hypothetical protein 101120B1-2_054 [Escherichia phage vB_EcoP-101120B1-2]QZI79861.1 hypothetical protein 101220B2_054 [Escherichia phage vB_EcoP-101120B2]QZI84345.1 hypothetical protein PM129_055 [Escherichia phage vB_EcoP-PM129]QZI84406.1 hypothetical protein PM131_055 [Escherichia phage vB_EcoP-PM131]QZI84467.1 hypothetical protein PM137_055 [Escherichia phage vB_EcoP-PM137]QZI84528.1 hypothetical protein PM139_055 [Escherichia phage vB_EcoP-PM139]